MNHEKENIQKSTLQIQYSLPNHVKAMEYSIKNNPLTPSELQMQHNLTVELQQELQRKVQARNRVMWLKICMIGSATLLSYPALITGLASLSAAIGSEILKLKYNSYDTQAVVADAAVGGLAMLVPSIVVFSIVGYCLKNNKLSTQLITDFNLAAFISACAGASGARLNIYPSDTMTDAQAFAASALGTLITTFGYYGLCYIYSACYNKPLAEEDPVVDVKQESRFENMV